MLNLYCINVNIEIDKNVKLKVDTSYHFFYLDIINYFLTVFIRNKNFSKNIYLVG